MWITDYVIKCKRFKFRRAYKNKSPIRKIKYIVIHYTASGSMSGTVDYFLRKDVKVSSHLVIDRDGLGTQLVPFNLIAWHAGHSHYKGLDYLNYYSIGIELVNEGKLKNICGTFYTGYGKIIPKEEVFEAAEPSGVPSYWHMYTDRQMYALRSVIDNLKKNYSSIEEVIGHSDISKQKLDPGRAFPWDKL